MRKLAALCLCVSLLATPNAAAQDALTIKTDIGWLEVDQRKRISVYVLDSVKGGCWTDAAAAKTAVSLELVRSGYVVADNESTQLLLTAAGYRVGNLGCISSYGFIVEIIGKDSRSPFNAPNVASVESFFWRKIFERSGILSGPGDLSFQMSQTLQSSAQEFLVETANRINAVDSEINAFSNPHKEYWSYWLNLFRKSKAP